LQRAEEPEAAEVNPAVAAGGRSDEEDDEEQEEHVLSSKLVAAVRNAELHAANARTEQVLRRRLGSPGAEAARTAAACKAGSTNVRFARKSEVTFFSLNGDTANPSTLAPTLLEYRRPLETKVFDGPSGHKAKRTTSSEAKASSLENEDEVSVGALWCHSASETSSAQDEHSPEGEEDEEEEWEDHCDDLAELMSQQRSCLLWSTSW